MYDEIRDLERVLIKLYYKPTVEYSEEYSEFYVRNMKTVALIMEWVHGTIFFPKRKWDGKIKVINR